MFSCQGETPFCAENSTNSEPWLSSDAHDATDRGFSLADRMVRRVSIDVVRAYHAERARAHPNHPGYQRDRAGAYHGGARLCARGAVERVGTARKSHRRNTQLLLVIVRSN